MSNCKSYAKALKEISVENNIDINQIISELQLVHSFFDEEFISFLKNPRISKENKKEIFKNAFTSLNKYVFSTLLVLIDNDSIIELNSIINELQNIIDEENGILNIELISVEKLSDEKIQMIKDYLGIKFMKKINIKETIDKNLVGGLIIKYQGKIIDGSLLTKQESLKEYLKK